MAVQGERIAAGFILITGLDGIRYAVPPQSIGIIRDADECPMRPPCSCTAGSLSGCRARWMT